MGIREILLSFFACILGSALYETRRMIREHGF